MEQDKIQSEKARYKHELQKMDEQLKEYRQNLTCGPIGCMGLVLVAAVVIGLLLQEPGAAIAAGVIGAIFVAIGTILGAQKANKLRQKRDEMRGWQQEVTQREVRQAAENAMAVEEVAKAATPVQTAPAPPAKPAAVPQETLSLVMLSAPEDRELAQMALIDELEISREVARDLLDKAPTLIKSGLSADAARLIANRLRNKGFGISTQE